MYVPPRKTLVIGTRTSGLARWQTAYVIKRLEAAWPDLKCEVRPYVTEGDTDRVTPLAHMSGIGVFTTQLESALRDGEIDLAVHSLKDLPTAANPDLVIGAIAGREDPRDALISRRGQTLHALTRGAIVGTSSTRRQAQLLAARGDLVVRPIRGNIETRLRKVQDGEYDATVLALAGLHRLGRMEVVTESLSLGVMLPAPGQAALAVQCRRNDTTTAERLRPLDDAATREHVTAERSFLEKLGGGCSLPVAAFADANPRGGIRMRGLVISTDGCRVIRVEGSGRDGAELGARLADDALVRGAAKILMDATQGTPAARSRPATHPLTNKRIIVTRAKHQVGDVAARLERLGAIPVAIPMIEIAPATDGTRVKQAIRDLPVYDWIVFTSANGVNAFFEAAPEINSLPGHIRVAAIGPATAEALRLHGIAVDFVPPVFIGEAVAEGLGDVGGRRVLLARAEGAGADLAEILLRRGARVEDVAIYRTVAARIGDEQLAVIRQGADAVMFTSGSTVRHFVETLRAAEPAVSKAIEQAAVACIGPVTAGTARELGLEVHVIADEHTTEGLIANLTNYFRRGRTHD